MRKFLLSLSVALLSSVAFAQYNVIVELNDGSEVKYSANNVKNIRIEKEAPMPAEETGLLLTFDEAKMTASVTLLVNKEATEVKIPSQVLYNDKVYDVVSIDNQAFYLCENLVSVEIPNSVITIGDKAFLGCRKLDNIEIPNSVTTIGVSAFEECFYFVSVEIPESVTKLGYRAFYRCNFLETARVPLSLKGKIDDETFPSTCVIEWY